MFTVPPLSVGPTALIVSPGMFSSLSFAITSSGLAELSWSTLNESSFATGAAFASVTVTRKNPLAVLPVLSETVQSTVVGPSGNTSPEGGLQVGGIGPSKISDAVAVYVTAIPDASGASIVISAGNERNGSTVSSTITLNVV